MGHAEQGSLFSLEKCAKTGTHVPMSLPDHLPCSVVYQRLILIQPRGSHTQVTKYFQHVVRELLI